MLTVLLKGIMQSVARITGLCQLVFSKFTCIVACNRFSFLLLLPSDHVVQCQTSLYFLAAIKSECPMNIQAWVLTWTPVVIILGFVSLESIAGPGINSDHFSSFWTHHSVWATLSPPVMCGGFSLPSSSVFLVIRHPWRDIIVILSWFWLMFPW